MRKRLSWRLLIGYLLATFLVAAVCFCHLGGNGSAVSILPSSWIFQSVIIVLLIGTAAGLFWGVRTSVRVVREMYGIWKALVHGTAQGQKDAIQVGEINHRLAQYCSQHASLLFQVSLEVKKLAGQLSIHSAGSSESLAALQAAVRALNELNRGMNAGMALAQKSVAAAEQFGQSSMQMIDYVNELHYLIHGDNPGESEGKIIGKCLKVSGVDPEKEEDFRLSIETSEGKEAVKGKLCYHLCPKEKKIILTPCAQGCQEPCPFHVSHWKMEDIKN